MEKIMYFNAYYAPKKGQESKTEIFIEMSGTTKSEAIKDIIDMEKRWPYAFSLQVDLGGETKRISLEKEVFNIKYSEDDDVEDEGYGKLTLGEMFDGVR